MKRPRKAVQGAAGKAIPRQDAASAAAAPDTAPAAPHERCHADVGLIQRETLGACTGCDGISPALVAAAGHAHAAAAAQAPAPGHCPAQRPPPLHACGHISPAHYALLVPVAAAAQTRDAARRALHALDAKARSAEAAQRSAENTLRAAAAAAAKHEARAADLRGRTEGGRAMRPRAQQAVLEKVAREESHAACEQARAQSVRDALVDLSLCTHAAQHALCAAREAEARAAWEFEVAAEPAESIPLRVLQRAVEAGLLSPEALLA